MSCEDIAPPSTTSSVAVMQLVQRAVYVNGPATAASASLTVERWRIPTVM